MFPNPQLQIGLARAHRKALLEEAGGWRKARAARPARAPWLAALLARLGGERLRPQRAA